MGGSRSRHGIHGAECAMADDVRHHGGRRRVDRCTDPGGGVAGSTRFGCRGGIASDSLSWRPVLRGLTWEGAGRDMASTGQNARWLTMSGITAVAVGLIDALTRVGVWRIVSCRPVPRSYGF